MAIYDTTLTSDLIAEGYIDANGRWLGLPDDLEYHGYTASGGNWGIQIDPNTPHVWGMTAPLTVFSGVSIQGYPGSADLYFTRSKNSTKGSHTILNPNDNIMFIAWAGSDGTDFNNDSGWIRSRVEGTPAANSVPSRIEFATCGTGASYSSMRFTIEADGDVTVEDGIAKANGFEADFAELQVSTATDHGGANGTIVAAVWDGTELHKDTRSFTHSTSTNPSRVTIVDTGRYHVKGVIACLNGGANRQVLSTRYRIDGGSWVTRGAQQDYSRGSGYNNDIRAPFDFEVDITAGSYVEVGTIVERTDASTTALATTDSSFIIRRIG